MRDALLRRLDQQATRGINVRLMDTLCDWESVPRLRAGSCCLEFMCPLTNLQDGVWSTLFQADAQVEERRALCAGSAGAHVFPDADHFAVGIDHAWDIARQIRGSFSFQP